MTRSPAQSAAEKVAIIHIGPDGMVLTVVADPGTGALGLPGGDVSSEGDPRAAALVAFEQLAGPMLNRLRRYRAFGPHEIRGLTGLLHVFFADDHLELSHRSELCLIDPRELADTGRLDPVSAEVLRRFASSDYYLGTVELQAANLFGACVISLDRWGRVLLQLRDEDLPPERYPSTWSIPGGLIRRGEPPDAAALREFEEETGCLLRTLNLFRVFRRDPDLPGALVEAQHVYYLDADLDPSELDCREGQELRYFAPDELADLPMPPHVRRILSEFLASTAYRRLFH